MQKLLDAVGTRDDGPIKNSLNRVVDRYVTEQETSPAFGWRYYFVKYPEMRSGDSGLYAGLNGAMGFSLCMLRRKQMNSWYRDPYLHAVCERSGVERQTNVEDPWFTGAEDVERWLRLLRSGVELRCTSEGYVVKPPTIGSYHLAFEQLVSKRGVQSDGLVRIPQVARDNMFADATDRVQLGAELLRDLVAMQPS